MSLTKATRRPRMPTSQQRPIQVYLPEKLYIRLWHYILEEQARGSVESMAGWVRKLILEALPEEPRE